MYQWRKISDQQRKAILAERRNCSRPWHSVPHVVSDTTSYYHVTGACYEHKPVVGVSPERMMEFENEWRQEVDSHAEEVHAWVILPNHYHVLLRTSDVKSLLKNLGQLHGRTSFRWNNEENQRGRHVWCNAAETAIKSERHFWATLNYVLNNPVRHGYVDRWQDWPYSNATEYLEQMGHEAAMRIWHNYPILDYGKDWDPPEM